MTVTPRLTRRGFLAAGCLAPAVAAGGDPIPPPRPRREKVVLDTDMGELNDDAYVLFMLARAPEVELLGVVVPHGNLWLEEGVTHALRNLERVGRADVPVMVGAAEPLLGLRADRMAEEERLFGAAFYKGAYATPRPAAVGRLARPPHGGHPRTAPAAENGVDFLVRTVKAHPGEVTVLTIGPATNLALAVRAHPEIVPLIRRVVYMGGAFDVPGNTTPAAEFNWWFDPEAARVAVRTPFREQLIVPLDVCERVTYSRAVYRRVVDAGPSPVADLFRAVQGPEFDADPGRTTFAWDAIAAAVLLDPSLVTRAEERHLDVDVTYGPNYGRALGYRAGATVHGGRLTPPAGTRPARVVFAVDEPRFWDLFVARVTGR